MKLSLLLLTLTLSACSHALRIAEPYSVQPLQDNAGNTFCTAFSINAQEGYWATAGHCAKPGQAQITLLFGLKAEWIFVSEHYDVAVVQAPIYARALRLAPQSPAVCVPSHLERDCPTLYIQGFPYGLPRMITVRGVMSAHRIPIWHTTLDKIVYSDLLDITVAGGNSGSPVLDQYNRVVGLLWGAFTEAPHSLSIPLDDLRASLVPYLD